MSNKYNQINKYACDKKNTKVDYYKLPNGLSIRHLNKHETDFVYNEVFEEKVYLKNGITIKDGGCILDVGANIGMFSLFVQHNFRDAKIYAIEPSPELCKIIEFNTSAEPSNVKVLKCGVLNENKEATFTFYPNYSILSGFNADEEKDYDTLKASLHSVADEQDQYEDECLSELLKEKLRRKEEYKCQLKTISRIMEENNIEFIDLLKVDVEKSEFEVLDGIDEKDWSKIGQIVIEVHDFKGDTLNKIKSLLEYKNFSLILEEDCLKNSGIVNIYAISKNYNREQLDYTNPNDLTQEMQGKSIEKIMDKIVVAGTFTTEPLYTGIEFWKETLGMNFDVSFTAYNQVFQELLRDGGKLISNTSGMNTILLRFDDWIRYAKKEKADLSYKNSSESISSNETEMLESIFQDFIKVIKSYTLRPVCFTLIMVCPPAPIYSENPSLSFLFEKFEGILGDIINQISGIEMIRVSDYHSKYGVYEVFDDISDQLGHIPYTSKYYNFLSTLIMRCFYSLKNKPYKVIISDCDNTLWNGVCGEVGWEGIEINDAHDNFHHFLKNKIDEGFLLCLCSKNDEEDVWDVFDNNKKMMLSREHILDSHINWQPKSDNIKLLAKSLNLGIDSFVFIDDNPVECAEVRSHSPEALTLQWSDDISFEHIWGLDNYQVTDEDRKRQDSYKANIKRKELMENSYSFEDFIESLKLDIKIEKVTENRLNRVSQLTERTNQFNFTTIRRSSREIQKLIDDDKYGCWTVEVKDRFGEYGIVGVMITREDEEVMELDTFLLSCRVLGRGVEYRMMEELGNIAKKKQLSTVRILYSSTKKNEPAKLFLEKLLEKLKDIELKENVGMLIPVEYLSGVKYKSSEIKGTGVKRITRDDKNKDGSYDDTRKKEEILIRIASQLNNIEDLSLEIDNFKRKELNSTNEKNIKTSKSDIRKQNDTYIDEVELYNVVLHRVKEIFSNTLAIDIGILNEEVGIEEYFKRDSLKIVEVTSKLKREFDNIIPTLLFEHKTLESIVKNIVENNSKMIREKYGLNLNSKKNIDDNRYEILGTQGVHHSTDIDSEVDEWNRNKSGTSSNNDEIAIIGVNGKFPKAQSIKEFWQNLRQGISSIDEVPKGRWDIQNIYSEEGGTGKTYCKWGGFLDKIDLFDASFFHISPREAETMDPQQRLFMEVVWGLLEDAGYTPAKMPRDTGVFVGVISNDYNIYTSQAAVMGESGYRNCDYYQIPNRISYFFNFNGPSVALDTACSSSGAALHFACESLKSKDCKTAIVGGLNLFVHPVRFIQYSQMQVMSRDNKCRPFGDKATGTLYGEGIGALLLKPLKDAKRDGDQIYGVIKSSAINSGGKTNGFTVPNPLAQGELISKAIRDANINPRTISYIEAHGTGTPLGDPIEIRGLTKAFTDENNTLGNINNRKNQYCAIGSVKSNIGHLESGAAIAGLIKILLQMKHKELVPSLNSETLNPMIEFENTPFYVQHETQKWEQPRLEINGSIETYPRRAGISSFGAGGVNAHIIIEEYENDVQFSPQQDIPQLVVISAKNKVKLNSYIEDFIAFLKADIAKASMPNLESIAYTLQIGRVPMEERLAVVAASIEELIDKLSEYSRNKTGIYRLYRGNTKSENLNSGLLLEGREGREYLNIIIKDRKLEKLAQLWVSGVQIDWDILYPEKKPLKISLPTYKFSGERHWIENIDKTVEDGSRRAKEVKVLHPMIDSNDSTFYEQRFKKTFSEKDRYIRDHIVNGQMVMPGVTCLEIAKVIGNLSKPDSNIKCINNVVWTRPVILSKDSKEVFFSLNPDGNHIKCKVWTPLDDGERLEHAEWNMEYQDKDEKIDKEQSINIDDIKDRCNKHINRSDCYSLLKSIGYNYGQSFQVIEELYYNKNEGLARLKLNEDTDNNIDMYPSLMDGALQTITGWISQINGIPHCPYVPFTVGGVEIIAPLTPNCYSLVTKALSSQGSDSSIDKYDVRLLNESGEILVIIRDYYPRAFEADKNQVEYRKIYYKSLWEDEELNTNQIEIDGDKQILVFDTDNKICNLLVKNFRKANGDAEAILVKPGRSFRNLGDNIYEINPKEEEDYRRLIEDFSTNNFIPDKIIHLWSCRNLGFDIDKLDKQLYMGLYSIQYLCKSIINQKFNKDISTIYTYINDLENLHPQYGAVNGMLRSIQSENSRLDFKTIELPYTLLDDESIDRIIRDELKIKYDNVCEIKYNSQKRFVKRFREFNFNEEAGVEVSNKLSALKDNGVYLITGGAGGLGLIFAENLVNRVKVKLVLTGRSKLNAYKKSNIKRLEELGAEVIYIRSDISKRDEVSSLISQIKARFNRIDGIIHMAGAIRDSLVVNKTQHEINEVIAPKVWGTIFLDEETKNENLDFFVLFSSTSSSAGHIGQSDYAYANRFLDEFSYLRGELHKSRLRSGKTLCINWPWWKDGGMKLGEAERKLLEISYGLRGLEVEDGCNIFDRAVNSSLQSFMFFIGDKNKVSQMLQAREKRVQYIDNGENTKENKEELVEKLKKDMRKIVSDILKMPIETIDYNIKMSEFGFDSITFTSFSNRVNQKYGLNISPAIFYEYPNLNSFVEYLYEVNTVKIIKHYTTIEKVHEIEKDRELLKENQNSKPNDEYLSNRYLSQREIACSKYKGRFEDSIKVENKDIKAIAVIGISGIFPGCKDLEEFWHSLEEGRDLVSEIPKDRWDWRKYYGNPRQGVDKTDVKWGGFIEDVDKFDPLFFGISPREAAFMDPQQRIFLETAWRATEDAGYKPSDLAGSKTGVFVGSSINDYNELIKDYGLEVDTFMSSGINNSIIANRISYLMDLNGPSEVIDTACSSSLVAVKHAVDCIRNGECDMAIAGGVNVILRPKFHIAFRKTGMLSPDGRCKTFDKDANGYVRGEGAGAIILKPLRDAQRDGDNIYGIIKGVALNHGGYAQSLTAPNPTAQAKLLVKAYKNANIPVNTIGYIEAHGTGTSLGDPIEINGLKEAFSQMEEGTHPLLPSKGYCGIGAVKTNIGHLEAASGIAGIIKVLLSIKNKKLPKNVHFNSLNPYINLEDTPFYILKSTKEWEAFKDEKESEIPRRAGVSSFGFGGTNAHIVIEEYMGSPLKSKSSIQDQIIVLSAKDEEKLKEYGQKLIQFLEKVQPSARGNMNTLSHGIELTLSHVLNVASKVLEVDKDCIDPYESIEEYGFDIFKIRKFLTNIKEYYGVNMDMKIFTKYPSLYELTEYIKHFIVDERSSTNKIGEEVTLANIAFTLQVGRKAMNERLALVVSSIDQLKDELSKYIKNTTQSIRYLRGSIKGKKIKNLQDLANKIDEESMERFIKNRELLNIAKAWVYGIDIDWKMLHGKEKHSRISLPTYPFARDRCWLPKPKEASSDIYEIKGSTSLIHPLVGENKSTLNRIKFATTLTGNEFYLRDHLIDNRMVLPGVTYVEMARASGEFAAEKRVSRIKNVLWSRPIVIDEGDSIVTINLRPEKDSLIYEVNTDNRENEPIVHGQGKLLFDSNIAEQKYIDIESIKSRCIEVRNKEEFYGLFEVDGAKYGPSFQSVKGLYYNKTEALTYMVLPQDLEDSLEQYVIHPSIMDGALQSITGLISRSEMLEGAPFLPFSIGEIRLLNPLTNQCYAYVSLNYDQIGMAPDIRKYNILIVDDNGKALISIENFTVRSFKKSSREVQPKELNQLYYYFGWEKVSLKNQVSRSITTSEQGNNVLVWTDSHEIYKDLQRRPSYIDETPRHITWVKPGDAYRNRENIIYEVNPLMEKDFRKLINELKLQDQMPDKVIFILSTNKKNYGRSLEAEINNTVYPLFYLNRELIRNKPKKIIDMLYLYRSSSEAGGDLHCITNSLYGAVSSLAKTVELENPKLRWKTIEILDSFDSNQSAIDKLINLALDEFESGMKKRVRYIEGERYIESLEEFKLDQDFGVNIPLKEKGVYIITGGMGGLGRITASYIADKVKARLVLTGRSELTPEKEKFLKNIRAIGSEAIYIKADMSREMDVEKLIESTKKDFGGLNGIFHCAGLINDGYLANKAIDDFLGVISPKIQGLIYLDEFTKQEKLDVFVLFSSISAAMGNMGQSDYAYANGFMDSYCDMREKLRVEGKRLGRTIAINWPLWQEGGMNLNTASRKYITTVLGMVPLDTETGVNILERSMIQPHNRFIPLKGNTVKLRDWINPPLNKETVNKEKEYENLNRTIDTELVLKEFEKDILDCLSKLLQIPVNKIKLNADLNSLGLSSLIYIDLANQINELYGLEIMPSVFFECSSPGAIILSLFDQNKNNITKYYLKTVDPSIEEAAIAKEVKGQANKELLEQEAFNPSKYLINFPSCEEKKSPEPIAVVGLSAIMPQSKNLKEFWNNLVEGRDLVTEIERKDWEALGYRGEHVNEPIEICAKWGGFLKGIDEFDAEFFNISKREAVLMDPQQRMFLQTVWKAIEDAGYRPSDLSGTRTGVFAGVANSDYYDVIRDSCKRMEAHVPTGIEHSVLANRISYLLNLHGPSEPVNTACSSSLVAIHRAIEALRSGDCGMAIVGGVNLINSRAYYFSLSKAGMLSPNGRCKTFDKDADGYVRGEGVGAIILKPLSSALRDGDYINALIMGSALNHGGRSSSLTAPNPKAQADLLVDAYTKANIDPYTIGYIESHGTGTKLGDPIEIEGLKRAFEQLCKKSGKGSFKAPWIGMGAVKTNIGHLESAAGVAGIIKVLLSLKHKKIPGNLHFNELNPYIRLEDSPFYIIDSSQEWKALTDSEGNIVPRRAGVSSFGFGGVNAHVILEEYKKESDQI